MANPYFAFLQKADILFITQDSTNMLTEAASTGKPLFSLAMAGQSGKFEQLYKALEKHCGLRMFRGDTNAPAYKPLDETTRVAKVVWSRFEQRDSKTRP